ncbi:MAG TPA: transporter substrate-binding domain-containing protein, partial [Candidatus Ozemobacteraceae bacterium]|nr:transporter substrate-binding domain-containing protein [Candidatus Ozemobacteraceae bacterium]
MAQSKMLARMNREEKGFDLPPVRFIFVMSVLFLLFAGSVLYADGTVSILAKPHLEMTSEEQAWLETHRSMKIGITTDWPPFEYLDDNGTYAGLAADYLKVAADELGLQITFDSTALPWDKVLQRISSKELDAVPAVSVSDRRRSFMNFTKPYIVIPNVVFIRKGSPQMSSLDDLRGKKLACMQGWIVQELLTREHPEIRLSLNEHIEGLLGQVLMGTADAGIIDLATLSHYSKRHHLPDITIAFRSPYSMNLGMGFRQDWPIMAGLFQKVFDGMSKEQTALLRDKWVSEPIGSDETLRTVIRWMVILVLLVIGGFIWNIQLRKLVRARTGELEKEVEQNRRQSAALAESERKLRAIFNQTFQYTGLLSKDGRLLQANRTSIKFYGMDEESQVGRLFWETPWWSHDPAMQERLKQAIARVAAGGFDRFETTHVSLVDGLTHHI